MAVPPRRFDTIVLGVGGMGSAAAYHLARRGQRVLGLERYDIPHEMGSSHGITRIIRLAYYEHPSYVPLLRRAYELWRELEVAAGAKLLHITGSVDAGPDGGFLVPEMCVSQHVMLAQAAGAEVLARERVLGWEPEGDGVIVRTEGGR